MITYQTAVLPEWVDYNGHLRDAFYLLIFSYATDTFMDRIGLACDDRANSGTSLFTLEAHINYLHEVKLGAQVEVQTQVIGHDHKRLHLFHSLHIGASEALAASEQMLLHVDLAGPKSAPFSAGSLQLLEAFIADQGELAAPQCVGKVISLVQR